MNRLHYIWLLLLSSLCITAFSQNTQSINTKNVEYFIQNKKIGLRDKSSHKVVVACKYDFIGGYGKSNRSVFKRGELYGYLDEKAAEIIKPQFQEAQGFGDYGFAAVKKNGKWGVINQAGRVVLPFSYDEVGSTKFGIFTAKQNGKWAVYNAKGERLSAEYDEKFYYSDSGFASVKKSGKCGVINRDGHEAIPCRYDHCTICEDLVMVQQKNLLGYLDLEGHVIIPITCTKATSFSDGIALIERDGKNMIISSDTRTLAMFEKGWLTDIYTDLQSPIKNPLFIYHLDGKEGLVDKNGKIIVALDEKNDFGYFSGDGLVACEINNRTGFYDIFTGAVKIPFVFEETYYHFSDGFIPAKKGGRWGVINTTGNTVVDFVYDKIDATFCSYLKACNSSRWGILDCNTGKAVIPCNYDEVGYPNKELHYCKVKNGGKDGYADFYGNDTL